MQKRGLTSTSVRVDRRTLKTKIATSSKQKEIIMGKKKEAKKSAEVRFQEFLASKGVNASNEKAVKKAKKIFDEIEERTGKIANHEAAISDLNKSIDKKTRERAGYQAKVLNHQQKIAKLSEQKI